MTLNTAIIMVGGLGERMYPESIGKTKNMVELNGHPIVDYQIQMLLNAGVNKIIFTYSKEMNGKPFTQINSLKKHIKDNYRSTKIVFDFFESKLEGNAEKVYDYLQTDPKIDDFLLLCCDVLTNADIGFFLRSSDNIFLCSKTKSKFSSIYFDKNLNITTCEEKPILPYWVNGGIYKFSKKTFPNLYSMDLVYNNADAKAFDYSGEWYSIETIKEIYDLENKIKKGETFLCSLMKN